MPISIRSLEAIIRLSTAYAKMRLSNKVELIDCVNGLQIFMKSFYDGYERVSAKFFTKQELHLLEKGRAKKRGNSRRRVKSKSKLTVVTEDG